MSILKIPKKKATIDNAAEIKACLADLGIGYERWQASYDISADATEDEVLQAYSAEIEKLKQRGGYETADVITLEPDTPNLDDILDNFGREHWHDEDEVRFIINGRGVFHIVPESGDVVCIEMAPGDLICVPKGTLHWFDLCEESRCPPKDNRTSEGDHPNNARSPSNCTVEGGHATRSRAW